MRQFSSTKFAKNIDDVFTSMARGPVAITRNGKICAVIMTVRKFERLKGTKIRDSRAQCGKRATRLPEDWEISAKEADFARKKGFFEQEIAEMADNFRDYWLSRADKGAVKLDWSRTWNMWVRRDIERLGPPRSRENKNGSMRKIYNSYDAANAWRDARERIKKDSNPTDMFAPIEGEKETITIIDEIPH